jgi:hypothetical protein
MTFQSDKTRSRTKSTTVIHSKQIKETTLPVSNRSFSISSNSFNVLEEYWNCIVSAQVLLSMKIFNWKIKIMNLEDMPPYLLDNEFIHSG